MKIRNRLAPRFWKSWLASLTVAVIAMGAIHGYQTRQTAKDLARQSTLWQRVAVADHLKLALEHYRYMSKSFRKLGDSGIQRTKAELKSEVAGGTSKLDALDPTSAESELGAKLNRQLADFMVLSAKLEPMLFLKDVYYKPEARTAHEAMVSTITQIRDSAAERLSSLRGASSLRRHRLNTLHFAFGAAIILLSALWMGGIFRSFVRPMRRLLRRAAEIRQGMLKPEATSRLDGSHGQIEKLLNDLALRVDAQARERHQFVTALAQDLRAPMTPLQTSAQLIASKSDELTPEQREGTTGQIRRSVARLNRTLDDLMDTLQASSGSIRLDEKIIDVRDVFSRVAALWSGAGSTHEFRVSAPASPVWAFVDGERLERVLLNLVGKIMQYSPQGGRIDLSLRIGTGAPGEKGGLEILVSEGSPQGERVRATGPEQELHKHWVSENGFGLGLSQRIIEAHGGQITAAGVAGTHVVFTIRLPEERLPAGIDLGAGGELPGLPVRSYSPRQAREQPFERDREGGASPSV